MTESLTTNGRDAIRIGVVTYLNARPLTFCLEELAPDARIVVDFPSRLADDLAAGRLDVALVPSIEYFRHPDYTIVSDACVACDGPVLSVKLYSRVPVEKIRRLALDEGSRTSAAMTRIVLREWFDVEPEICVLPIGASVQDVQADAAMLMGDRGMLPIEQEMEFVWDMGQQWSRWTGLPFVFAMWVARAGADLTELDATLTAARDRGVLQLAEIARQGAGSLGISQAECLAYLRDNLQFQLGPRQQQGLQLFADLAAQHGLIPPGVELGFYDQNAAR